MTSSAKKLLQQALALPEEEREAMGTALLESVAHEPEHGLSAAWREELTHRLGRLQRGEAQLVATVEVEARARQVLERARRERNRADD